MHPNRSRGTSFQEIDMSDTVPTPATGNRADAGKPDGVNTPGRGEGGDSGGGSYPNPHSGKDGNSDVGGFLGHGGQTDIGYHGGGQRGTEGSETDNATTRGDGGESASGNAGQKDGPTGPEQDFDPEYPRDATVAGRRVEIVDTSGIAAAEAAGTTGTDGAALANRETPGAG
jgi:hypothetical protein